MRTVSRRRSITPPRALTVALALLATLMLPGATGATENASGNCLRHRNGNGAWVCNIGVENLACGNSWHCKTLNVTNEQPQGGCVCVAYSTKASSGCTSAGTQTAQAMAPLTPGATVPFVVTASVNSKLLVFDNADIDANGVVTSFTNLNSPGDFTGNFALTLGSGPPNAIPARITALNIQVNSLNFRGMPTGTNSVALATGGANVLGSYDQTTGQLHFNEPVPCIWTCPLFPNGHPVQIRPEAALLSGNVYEFLPAASAEFAILPLLTFPLLTGLVLALLLVSVGTLVWRRRQMEGALA